MFMNTVLSFDHAFLKVVMYMQDVVKSFFFISI